VTTAGRRDARLGVTRARMFASAKKPLEKREKKKRIKTNVSLFFLRLFRD
jgi:hypothetical protein